MDRFIASGGGGSFPCKPKGFHLLHSFVVVLIHQVLLNLLQECWIGFFLAALPAAPVFWWGSLTGAPFISRGAGTGGLGLAIEGPSEAKMSCKDNKDGSCSVEYIPFTPGDYDVNITFGGRPIPGRCGGWGQKEGRRGRYRCASTYDSSFSDFWELQLH